MFAKDSGLLQGTLELLVLKTLSWGPMHGYGIASWIESATGDVLSVEEGSLYPALYRLEDRGLIRASWGISPEGRRAKFYTLTAAGRQNAISMISVSDRGSMLDASSVFYMDKIVVGPSCKGAVDIDAPVHDNLKNIARRLGTSVKTVDVHRARIKTKTEAESIATLVRG